MREDDITRMAIESGIIIDSGSNFADDMYVAVLYRFANLIAKAEREACIEIIETYRIPVGNSASGELACEWTYAALHEIRDAIRARNEK